MLEEILQQVQEGTLGVAEAKEKLATFENLGYAKVDHHRKKRQGFPEVVYGEGKTSEQIISIIQSLKLRNNKVLVTRSLKTKPKQYKAFVLNLFTIKLLIFYFGKKMV